MQPQFQRRIAEAVHAYFRWCGWNAGKGANSATIRRAIELDQQFEERPASIPVDQLREYAVPAWISEHLDVTPPWLRSLQERPKLWLRTRKGITGEVVKALDQARRFRNSEIVEYYGRDNLFESNGFRHGSFEIQDISSQIVSLICDPAPGETWWDVCAGEGGKTMHLSDLMGNRGLIWATDRAEWRLKRLKKRAARVKAFNYRTKVWNGNLPLPTKTKFDGVLVDGPCSGVGTWRRDPQARWTTEPKDVSELAELQLKILSNASRQVKPGGRLIYSVCTLTNAETWEVAKKFTQANQEFMQLTVVNPFAKAEDAKKALLLWPQTHSGNGMFISIWKRKE